MMREVIPERGHPGPKPRCGEEILVEISQSGGRFDLRVADNGTGPPFAVYARPRSDDTRLGLGMRSMVSRAEVMGGELEVRPRPGGGTIVALSIPVAETR